MSNILTRGMNGKFDRAGDPEISFKLRPDGKTNDIKLDGNPQLLCQMVFDGMKAHPEIAKVLLTCCYQFMKDQHITDATLKKHTFLADGR